MTLQDFRTTTGRNALLGYLAIWLVSTAYLAFKDADWSFPVISLILFGTVLSAVGWFLTRRSAAPPVSVARPARQVAWLLAYLLLYAFVLIGWGLGALKAAIPEGQLQDVAVLVYKLAIHVAIPAALIAALGGALRDTFDPGLRRRGIWLALIVMSAIMIGLLAVVSPSLKQLGEAGLTGTNALPWIAGSWLWISLEAGLCEEYLFRAGLQSRLAAWLHSPVAAILITSVLFALAHWPGLYLRGGPDVDGWSTDPIQVAAFTIASLSPLAVMLGTLWARTRSLVLVVMVHGAIDALPHATEFFKIWH